MTGRPPVSTVSGVSPQRRTRSAAYSVAAGKPVPSLLTLGCLIQSAHSPMACSRCAVTHSPTWSSTARVIEPVPSSHERG